jgi:DNA-binding LacI/PurR family transcriptional regulator
VSQEAEPTRAANIFDVARLAGVSHQTVSRVINNQPNVRPATRVRVEKAIAQLRYSPSPAARALVTRRTRTIGLIVPAVSDYGPTSIAIQFNIAARAARYNVDTVTAVDIDPAGIRSLVEGLLRQRVDAIVVIVNDIEVLEVVQALDLNIPLVAAAATVRHSPRLVSVDQYRGARSAVRHLADLGHTRILHIAGPTRAPDTIERVRGWRDEVSTRRLEVIEPLHGEWTAASGFTLGLELDIGPDSAVFVANDHMAIGLLSALRERDIRVPADVSVVGFDDVPEAGYLVPPLTTVRQDFAALGELIMQKVLVSVEEPDRVTEDTPLATRLIVRQSTRAVDQPGKPVDAGGAQPAVSSSVSVAKSVTSSGPGASMSTGSP